MKKLLIGILLIFFSSILLAQTDTKNDVILKLNGDELVGKVMEIDDNEIKFTYKGESLVYKIKKTDVLKITYSSGRIEMFSKPALPSEASSKSASTAAMSGPGLADHHNKVAILPYAFLKDGETASDDISFKVQNETFAFLNRHAGVMSIVDPRTSNALLIKAGINRETIKGYTMDDLCNILGVEYVIDGIVSVNKGNQTNITTGNSNTTYSSGNNNKNNQYKSREKSSGSVVSTSTQNFETSLTLSIYNDKGVSIYSQERRSFWNTQDAYKITLEYLLKRCPLYSK
ncbi:hypothetical protein L0U88_15430 [Flavihumibacter sp. RY-1]|uniref:Secretin/TonB short N-terminal domain-containing protein n=1 Tax=Flavihumibacter fluminis TaxID=2909236 RepID=A0ABS9BK06_9BACT|nr:hypothetical protein [Flavihumibacter fluminis]MCF1716031.1 hypothetical protein [Flavihumibacter fluminis]